MNIEEYISSGILEAYALGELTDTERAAVEKNLSQYPTLRTELDKIEAAQEAFLMQSAIQPRSHVKEELFKKIQDGKKEAKVVPIQHAGVTNVWRYVAAACILLTLVSSFIAYNYWSKWKNTKSDLDNLVAQNQQMANDYNRVNSRLDKIENELNVTNNPAFKRIVMNGTANAPNAQAAVYWNEDTQEVYLSVQKMKELSRENQYQLWALVDGKPVDAGVFDADLTGLIKMKNMPHADAFAVTIEPRGGKDSPTLETMQMIGNIQKS